MASVSISITAAQVDGFNPDSVVVAASAPGAGDVELRVNTANVTNLKAIILGLEKFITYIEDQAHGPANFKLL